MPAATVLAVLLLGQAVTAAQFSVSTNAGDEFVRLGRDTNGTVWMAGARNGVATLFQANGTNFNVATLAALNVGDDTYAFSISRDARYVVGISGDEATIWNVTTPGTVTGLGIPAGRSYSEAHGVSTGTNPIVVGSAGIGSFVWTSGVGIQAYSNPPGHGGPRLTAISADGQTMIGYATAVGPTSDSFVDQAGTISFLNELGGNRSAAFGISPDGNAIGGVIDGQGTIWRKGTNWPDSLPLRLSINSNPVGEVFGVSDTGFAVGTTEGGGYVHDPRTGVTSWFDDWWQNETGSAVPHHVTGVNDVYESGGQLYFALATTSSAALASVNAPTKLEVLPPSGGLMRVRFPTAAGRNYQLLTAPSLPSAFWPPVPGASLTGDGAIHELTAPIIGDAAFFRLQISTP